MSLTTKLRDHKLVPVTLVLATLTVGIMIGTVVNTGVKAEKKQSVTDATPLTIPSPVQMGNEFTAIAQRLEPAVVYVTTLSDARTERAEAPNPRRRQAPQSEEDIPDFFRRFFEQPRGNEGGAEAPQQGPRFRREGTGSGFIVDPKGYIITNNHVVDGAGRITVKLHGEQTEYKAKLIGADPETDLAVIQIDAGRSLPYAKVGNSDAVQVGDWAIAIGSPFGLDASVTAGIISAKGRDTVAQQFQSFIQTDAAINPGNSGGPLLNIKGEVIGVNTMIATRSGGNQGIGFALPINTAVEVYNQLIDAGRVSRGSIGIRWSRDQRNPELMKALGIDGGVYVDEVPDGPAKQAGIKPEDIITAINGKPLKGGEDLVDRVAHTPIGNTIKLTVDRGGKKMEFAVVVRDRTDVFPELLGQNTQTPAEKPEEGTEAKFGIYVKPLSQSEREEMKLDGERGVQVTRILQDSFAEDIGLLVNDVIVSINRQPVESVEDIRKVQSTLKGGDPVAFRVLRPNPLSRAGRGPAFIGQFVTGTLPRE